MKTKKHPIKDFFDDVAAGWSPTTAEIDDCARRAVAGVDKPPLSLEALRQRLRKETDRVAALRNEGSMGAGRRHAREVSSELTSAFAGYTPEPTEADKELDPRKLAGAVPSDRIGHTATIPDDADHPRRLASDIGRY